VTFEGEPWRVFTESIPPSDVTGHRGKWIQVGQEMDAIVQTLANLRNQMMLGLPLALLLAGLGGYFLAWRALRPIEQITHTAQAINAGDLSRRIDHQGPADEIGRLAGTFDRMLGRLEKAFERQRRFTADAAHELRTPLAALKGRIEVTLNRPRTAATYAETLQEMGSQVDRLIRLSNDLLFIARLDDPERQTVQQEKVELESLLDAVVDQVQPLARRKEIALAYAIPGKVEVEGDLDLLIRLFLNLLDNAIKYTPSGGRVFVTAQTRADEAVIAVSDSGPGIPAEHLPHLFQRFYRVEADRARLPDGAGEDGTGLGLAIASEIVRVHGGRIDVESRGGEGATFTVRLPCHR
jgi:heavy metal sensor kinase